MRHRLTPPFVVGQYLTFPCANLEASIHPSYPLKPRDKRELFYKQDIAWAWFPSWTGWGIDMMKRLNNYSSILDEIMERNSDDIAMLNIETRAIRKQLELHELAIESMSAALTGLCEMTEDYECCTWISNMSAKVPDYYDTYPCFDSLPLL